LELLEVQDQISSFRPSQVVQQTVLRTFAARSLRQQERPKWHLLRSVVIGLPLDRKRKKLHMEGKY